MARVVRARSQDEGEIEMYYPCVFMLQYHSFVWPLRLIEHATMLSYARPGDTEYTVL